MKEHLLELMPRILIPQLLEKMALSLLVIKPNLDPLTQCTAKPIYWHQVMVKKNTVFIAGPSQEKRKLMLKRPELQSRWDFIWIFKGIFLFLQKHFIGITLGSTDVLAILRLPIHEHRVCFHLLMSSFISFSNALLFLLYKCFTSLIGE